MKYSISWTEESFVCSWSSRSLIKTFEMVYGVNDFIIKCRKFSIYGSRFIRKNKYYDKEFHYLLSCFLTPKKINKFYKLLCNKQHDLSISKGQLREMVKYQKIMEKVPRSTISFNDSISNIFGEPPKEVKDAEQQN